MQQLQHVNPHVSLFPSSKLETDMNLVSVRYGVYLRENFHADSRLYDLETEYLIYITVAVYRSVTDIQTVDIASSDKTRVMKNNI